jgi:uncharacterized membrane protein
MFTRTREALRTGLWFVPTVFVIGAIALWAAMHELDQTGVVQDLPFGFSGGPEGAREVLSAIATSMIAFTGVVFSVTIVALQLASSQYSPRVLRSFLRDRRTQVALGSFIATFVYALLVLRGVRTPLEDQEPYVPRFSVGLALLFLGFSLAMFVVYINQIAQSIRASRIIARIGDETRVTIDRLLDDETDTSARATDRSSTDGASVALRASDPGIIVGYDAATLIDLARESQTVLTAPFGPGMFVPTGATLLVADPEPDEELPERRLEHAVRRQLERSMDEDLLFGFRQLVDVALRALSPSLNDPTTAAECLDQLHDLLRRIAPRALPSGEHRDEDGRVRFRVPAVTWDDLVEVTFTEIRDAAHGQVQVQRRLALMLDDLMGVALPERRPSLARQRLLLADPESSSEPAVRSSDLALVVRHRS